MSGNKRGYISQEDARCLPGAAAACHPLQSSTLASSLSFVQGKMMGQHTLWRSEKGFNIALTKGNLHRWLMRRMGLHCFADDSFCATLLPDPSPGQLRVVKHSLDYVARMKDKSSCLGKINKKKWERVFAPSKLYYSSVVRTKMSSHGSAFRWKMW